MKFYITDAFTNEKYGGNTAGVVLVEQEFPGDGDMTRIAAELRYSETAFVKRTGEKSFHTRYFTPVGEVDLCGHATIAAFFTLGSKQAIAPGRYQNSTLAGELEIEVAPECVFMEMAPPKHIQAMDDPAALCALYGAMGMAGQEVNPAFLPEIISTGLPDIVLPVENEKVLETLSPDFPELAKLSEKFDVVGVHAFAMGTDKSIHCRNFAPRYGIDEEAATGTANGALTYYLYRHGLLENGAHTRFIQGEAMGRRSEIYSRLAVEADGAVTIQIGGSAAVVAEGMLL